MREPFEDLCDHLLTREAEPVRNLLLERLRAGKDCQGLGELMTDHPDLNLDQRVQLYLKYQDRFRPFGHYQLVLAALNAGHDRGAAEGLAEEFFAAAEQGRIKGKDSYHWSFTVKEPFDALHRRLLVPKAEPVRKLLLGRLAAGKDTTGLGELMNPHPRMDLGQRLALYHSYESAHCPFGHYQVVADALAAGYTQFEARALTWAISKSADKAREHARDDFHWSLTVAPLMKYYRENLISGPESAFKTLLDGCVKAGYDLALLPGQLKSLEGSLSTMSPKTARELVEMLPPAGEQRSLGRVLWPAVKLLSLREPPPDNLEVMVNEEEVRVGDFLLDRQD